MEIPSNVGTILRAMMHNLTSDLVPPYGSDTVPALQTIFDVRHLQGSSKFLDVQCRFISLFPMLAQCSSFN